MYRSIHPPRLLATMATLVILIPIIAACSAAPAAVAPTAVPEARPAVNLTLSGATVALTVMSAVQPAFETAQPGYHLDVSVRSGAGSNAGPTIQGVADRTIDIAAISRGLNDEEQKLGLESAEVGKMGTAVFTHPGVGVASLTLDQVRGIFTGKVTNWSEVGGPTLPIVVFARSEDNASTGVMRKEIFGDIAFAKQSQMVDKSDQLQVAVEGTPGGIGYGGWPGFLVKGTTLHAVALDGVGPLDSGYPVTQPLVLCYHPDNKDRVQPLIDWLGSEPGQAALQKFGVVKGK
jgi:phosphate transport system substrate-binding protein